MDFRPILKNIKYHHCMWGQQWKNSKCHCAWEPRNFTAGQNNSVQHEWPSNTLNKQPVCLLVALRYISTQLNPTFHSHQVSLHPHDIKAIQLHPARSLRCNHALQLIKFKGEALPGQCTLSASSSPEVTQPVLRGEQAAVYCTNTGLFHQYIII